MNFPARHTIERGLTRRISTAFAAWYAAIYPMVRDLHDLHKQEPERATTDWNREREMYLRRLTLAILWAATEVESAEQDAYAAQGASFDLDPQNVVDNYDQTGLRRLTQVGLTTQRSAQAEIDRWAATDEPIATLTERLDKWFGETRSQRIATNETGFLMAATARVIMQRKGWNRWLWVHGEICATGPCELCAASEGRIYSSQELMPPAASHIGCVLPGNKVSIAGLVAGAKSFYHGRAVEIRVANGSKLSVTPNHPILTTRGWVKAELLREGDDVIVARDAEGIMARLDPNHEHIPTEIEQVFRSLEESIPVSTRSVPASTEDLHGDGRWIDGNINIIYSNRLLGDDREPKGDESSSEDAFDRGNTQLLTLNRFGEQFSLGNSDFAFAGSRMRSACDFLALSGRGLGHTQQIGSRAAARLNTLVQQHPADNDSRDAYLARDFIFRHAGEITTSPVRSVRFFDCHSHVYDLQSRILGLYSGNGIIVKNCDCYGNPLPD